MVDTSFTCRDGSYEVRVPTAAKGSVLRTDYFAEGFEEVSIENPDSVEDLDLVPKQFFPGVVVRLVIESATSEVIPDAEVYIRPTTGFVLFAHRRRTHHR